MDINVQEKIRGPHTSFHANHKHHRKNRKPTYHGTDAHYALPDDTHERERLEDQIVGFVEMMHGHETHAPVENPLKVIDAGCATGIQAYPFAKAYPKAQIYGIDLSPIPERSGKPSNLEFIQGDVRKLIKQNHFEPGSIDFVFSRLLTFSTPDWQDCVNSLVSLLKPGGWVELQEYDIDWYSYPDGKAISDSWSWLTALRNEGKKKGWDLQCGTNLKGYFENAGLVDVKQLRFDTPIGTWLANERPETKRIGSHAHHEYGPLFHHIVQKVLGGVHSEEEVAKFQAEIEDTLEKEDQKTMRYTVTIGRKPEA